jgi:hypothetical protein
MLVCRLTLEDVSGIRGAIEAKGIRPVFVHLGTPERAKPYFDYVQSFGCPKKKGFFELSGFGRVEGVAGGAIRKHGIGMIKEDGEQMPGIFYLRDRAIVRAFRYKTIADEPDYLKIIA